ncbi:hypothetical protein EDD22DRAFT_956211 [Suillus occidentalis]|nr:hypothetical protein EDD22DRAFT_956211 [Suillus occidentalis]
MSATFKQDEAGLNDARHDEAADHLTAAMNSSPFSSNFIREDFVVSPTIFPALFLFSVSCPPPPAFFLLIFTSLKSSIAFLEAGWLD